SDPIECRASIKFPAIGLTGKLPCDISSILAGRPPMKARLLMTLPFLLLMTNPAWAENLATLGTPIDDPSQIETPQTKTPVLGAPVVTTEVKMSTPVILAPFQMPV